MFTDVILQQQSPCFEFMRPIVDAMVRREPADRPTINEAFARFEKLRGSLSQWSLRSRVVSKDESSIRGFLRACRHAFRVFVWTVNRSPALPTPSVSG